MTPGCSTSHDSHTGYIPGVWNCLCAQCRYGTVLIVYIYIYSWLHGSQLSFTDVDFP
jgi:hypothetical protein